MMKRKYCPESVYDKKEYISGNKPVTLTIFYNKIVDWIC